MQNNPENQTERQLKEIIFSEPSSHQTRPQIVDYLHILNQKIQNLDTEHLLNDEGHAIAMDITGALAFQGAEGVKGEDWITPEREPLLYDILGMAATLDADPNNPEAWRQLSDLLDEL